MCPLNVRFMIVTRACTNTHPLHHKWVRRVGRAKGRKAYFRQWGVISSGKHYCYISLSPRLKNALLLLRDAGDTCQETLPLNEPLCVAPKDSCFGVRSAGNRKIHGSCSPYAFVKISVRVFGIENGSLVNVWWKVC